LTALGQYLTTDLKEGCAPSQKMFEECLEVNYAKHAFEIYEKQVATISTSMIKSLKIFILLKKFTVYFITKYLAISFYQAAEIKQFISCLN